MLQELANANEFIIMGLLILFFTTSAVTICRVCTNDFVRNLLNPCEAVTPPFIVIPAAMFSLTAALMAASLWENYSGAAKAIRIESQGIRSYIQLAETIPRLKEFNLVLAANEYTQSVVQDEWPMMAMLKASKKTEKSFQSLQIETFQAVDKLGNIAESKALMNAYQNINDGRNSRLSYIKFDIHPVRWVAVLMLAILMQLGVAAVNSTKPKALIIAMALATLTILTALCTMTLTLSNPYVGVVAVSNEAFITAIRQ